MTRLLVFAGILLFTACSSVHYELRYNTYLEKSKKKELHFEDDKFIFDFITVSNGIYFSIKNLTDKTAFLIWDKSYFIEPDGNSYKAINLDLLIVEEEIAYKELNESVLPRGTSFSRFTTPNINVDMFYTYDVTQINNYFLNYFKSGDYSKTTVISKDFFDIGNYWTTILKYPKSNVKIGSSGTEEVLDVELGKIRKFIAKNDKLGLGLAIKMNDEIYDYQFNFKLKEARLYEVSNKKSKLIKIATDKSNWIWTNVE